MSNANEKHLLDSREVTKCSRCHKPMSALKVTSDVSDICFNCLTEDEKDYASSPEVIAETKKRLGCR